MKRSESFQYMKNRREALAEFSPEKERPSQERTDHWRSRLAYKGQLLIALRRASVFYLAVP
jgi:hypothetical protein